eukprot:6476181-Amphidinium_carterae.2
MLMGMLAILDRFVTFIGLALCLFDSVCGSGSLFSRLLYFSWVVNPLVASSVPIWPEPLLRVAENQGTRMDVLLGDTHGCQMQY